MGESIITITSDDRLEDIEKPFKVIAGPGAGKTHWLIEHIKNVLLNSTKLSTLSKISCITYTTVGAEEVKNRLKDNLDKVDVSTIHSFLYANIVKPYVHLLKDDSGRMLVNIDELDGHFENVATKGKVFRWQSEVNNVRFIRDQKKIKMCLENIDWVLDNGSFLLKPRKEWLRRIGTYYIKLEDLPTYKKIFWDEGIIHHEDVLYFSYRILKEFPIILEHLSAKYPYMFLDEFQDTNPIQSEIIKWLGSAGTIIGVIGDPAQSIYSFQGASRSDFVNFRLPNLNEYQIENNRRSGEGIVKILNHLRQGDSLAQCSTHNQSNNPIYYFECEDEITQTLLDFHNLRQELGLENDYCILTRNNDSVKKLRNIEVTNVWSNLNEADSDRERLLKSLFTAYMLVEDGRNELAVKEVIRSLRTDKNNILKSPFQGSQFIDSLSKRSLAVDLLEFIMDEIKQSVNFTLLVFYQTLYEFLKAKGYNLKKITRGNIKTLAEQITMQELIENLILPEEKSTDIRTIHKAKGAEFKSVLLYLDDVEEIENIIHPEIHSANDDTRIYYVALSRARDLLCIAGPLLTKVNKEKLSEINIIEVSKEVISQ
ncbi:UvrD-helicase domain-containing protein [Virgibacillus halodenitrificans]|uniref:UvrD-helicase domain-containing protein n=1 Tax=Virgibacillus halodenitrificans TaxID=1482 RepID=UPI000EF4B8FC|nr:ATP-dependent helicase [Virgibacillus halodenitrificans]MYL57490.1 AAA family ATPase [Virgibacillus halodenitrificans]